MYFAGYILPNDMRAPANILTEPREFQFIAGVLCLDFTNTVGGTRGPAARERLKSYPDLIAWCRQAGLVPDSKADALLRAAVRRPAESAAALQRAIALRETIYRIFEALAGGKSPPSSDVTELNAALAGSLGRLRLVSSKQGFTWTWADSANAFDEPLGPVARSAAELLTSPHLLERLHQCEGDTCGWLFIDSTRNHSRRWCVMSDCGNVAKVRRFRLRKRRGRAGKS
jgi:predicted RNA-binding Zn ribbon-like protein